MLTLKQANFIREQLATAKNPLFFFDDDPDGLCSFLLLYKINREGHGTIVKTLLKITALFLRKVEEYNPDKIFILDVPIVEQEFIDAAKRPIFWLDHHQPLERQNIHYFNPRSSQPDLYFPTTGIAYQVNQDPENLWIAMVGCISDYHIPYFQKEFLEKYPDLMEKNSTIEKAIYGAPIGKLARIFSFLLKGKTSEVNKCIKILSRIKSPYEILKQQTSQGKYIYKRFESIDSKYQLLFQQAKKQMTRPSEAKATQLGKKTKSSLLLFTYTEQAWSFTAELAGELLYFNPEKIVIVARKKSGEMKCSLRSKETPIPPILEKALVGIEGYGGGHEFACGASIKGHDWQQFLVNFKREIK